MIFEFTKYVRLGTVLSVTYFALLVLVVVTNIFLLQILWAFIVLSNL